MIQQLKNLILGVNAAALVRGLRLGPTEFYRCCEQNLARTHPMENRFLATLPQVDLREIVGVQNFSIRFVSGSYVDGALRAHEAFALASILSLEHPREVLEIGTFMGHTSRLMAETLENAIIHTVDLPLEYSPDETSGADISKDDFHLIRNRQVGREFHNTPVAGRIIQHYADTMTWDFAGIGRPTFFFIDGSHTYEACRSDSEKCYALSDGKAAFLWHDCDSQHVGVARALAEWRNLGRNVVRIRGTALAYWKGM